MIGVVYSISDSSGSVFYIGSTFNELKERASQHKSWAKSSKTPVYKYVRDNNIEMVFEVIEEIEFDDDDLELRVAEYFWIEQFRCWGFPIKNRNRLVKAPAPKKPSNRRGVSISVDLFKILQKYKKDNSVIISLAVETFILKGLAEKGVDTPKFRKLCKKHYVDYDFNKNNVVPIGSFFELAAEEKLKSDKTL